MSDCAVRLAMMRSAKQYGRYGDRKVTAPLQGLQLANRRHETRRRPYHKGTSVIGLRPTHSTPIWATGFVHDKHHL